MKSSFKYILIVIVLFFSLMPMFKAEGEDENPDNLFCNLGGESGLNFGRVSASFVISFNPDYPNANSIFLKSYTGKEKTSIPLLSPIALCKDLFGHGCDTSVIGISKIDTGTIIFENFNEFTNIYSELDGKCPSVIVKSVPCDKNVNNALCGTYTVTLTSERNIQPSENTDEETKVYTVSTGSIDPLSFKPLKTEEFKKKMDTISDNFGIPEQIISKEVGKCTDYLGSASQDKTTAHFIDNLFDITKIGAVIVMIIISIIDFAGTITKSKDELMETVTKNVKRIIVLLIIILLPTFIDILGNIFGVEDILCGIK